MSHISSIKENLKKFKLMTAASHKTFSNYVDHFSQTLRLKAETLQESKILRLIDGDVRAKELYYHKQCLRDINNRLSLCCRQFSRQHCFFLFFIIFYLKRF